MQIWASLAESPEGVGALVFEDDTDPTITSEQVDAALVGLPDDWDIVLLGVFGEPYDPARLSIRRVEWFFGAHAYVVRRRCAQKLLASALPMHVQLDSWLSRLSMGRARAAVRDRKQRERRLGARGPPPNQSLDGNVLELPRVVGVDVLVEEGTAVLQRRPVGEGADDRRHVRHAHAENLLVRELLGLD